MPIELYAIGSSALALVAIVLMVLTRVAPDKPPKQGAGTRDG